MLKKLTAFIAAASMTVTAATFTASAAEDRILSVGFPSGYNYQIENKDNMTEKYLGAARLVAESWCADGEYADPGFILDYGYGASLEDYSALEVEYDCANPDEIEYISAAVQGGTVEWHTVQAPPNDSGKIVLDLSKKRDKTYDLLQFWVHPISSYKLGDVFDPGITIKSAKLIAADGPFVQGIGATVLTPNEWSGDTYGLPEYSIVESWTNPRSLMKYSSLELEYECGNVSEIESLKLVVHGGTCEWTEIQALPDESGKIVLDLTDIRDKTYEAALLYVQPIDSYEIGDTFDPKIVVTRAEFIADPDWIMSMEFTDKPVNLNVGEYSGGSKYAQSEFFWTEFKGTLTWGELKNDTFKLSGIEYKNDSLNGSADDFEIYPCIKFQGGRWFFPSNIVTVGFQNQTVEWKLNDIARDSDLISIFNSGADHITVEGIGYLIAYAGDMSGMTWGDVIILNQTGAEKIPVDLTFSDGQHTLFICSNSYYDSNENIFKTDRVARNYVELPQPDGIEYGVTSFGELNGKTFTLNGINFKDCSIDGITASDIRVMFCIRTDDGYDQYFSGVTMDHSSGTWTAYFNQGDALFNKKIMSLGYGLWIENDITNAMDFSETIIVNRKEIVNDEYNISVSPVEGGLDSGLTLDVSENNIDDIEVKPEDKASVGKILLAYDIKLMNGTESVQPNCTIKISIPVPEGLNGAMLKVYHLQQDGSFIDMNSIYDAETNTISFETNHLSVYVISESSLILGDVNGDGKINNTDIILLGRAYMAGTADKYLEIADMNSDGRITNADIILLGRLYMSL